MSDPGFTDGRLARLDALHQIAAVVVANVEAGCAGWQRLGEKLWFAGLDISAGYPDPTVFAVKPDAMALACFVDYLS